MTAPRAAIFAVLYAAELSQYIVERGEMRVVPTVTPVVDADGAKRAQQVCETLNRVYAQGDANV